MKALAAETGSFKQGLRDGVPICLGYFSVSFAFGIAVVGAGYPPWIAVLISASNLTSAGQLAGLTVLSAGGGWIEMAMTQLVINLRYALMSFSLTQKLSGKFRTIDRLLASYVVTDEIFAVAISQPGEVSRRYLFGLALTPFWGWTLGTLTGAVAGGILPASVVSALGIAIYGMFIAIVVPQAQKFDNVRRVVLIAILISCGLHFVPWVRSLSEGFCIIVSAVFASLAGAWLWPVDADAMAGKEQG